MKTLISVVVAFAALGAFVGAEAQTTGVTVQEADGTPRKTNVRTIKVTNGTLTVNADGSVSLASGAGASAAADVTVADTGELLTADDVEAALAEIATTAAAALPASGGTGTNATFNGIQRTTKAWTADGATLTVSLDDADVHVITISANTEVTIADWKTGTNEQFKILRFIQDATGGRLPTLAGATFGGSRFIINPRTNTQSDVYLSTSNAGTNVTVDCAQPDTITLSVVKPNDIADAQRDACFGIPNPWGKTRYLTNWRANADVDDTAFAVFKTDSAGANAVTMDAVNVTTGSGTFFADTDASITAGEFGATDVLWINFDDDDIPGRVTWQGDFW